MGHREWSICACSRQQEDKLTACYTLRVRRATLPDLSSKQMFRSHTYSLHFIRLCAEFSFVYSNNHRMLLYKNTYFAYRISPDRSPQLLSVQFALTPGLYPGPGVYPEPGYYPGIYGTSKPGREPGREPTGRTMGQSRWAVVRPVVF